MDVPNILRVLCDRYVEIEIHKSAVKDAAEEEFKRFSEYVEPPVDPDLDITSYRSLQSMYFQDLQSGDLFRYGFRKFTAEHKLRMISKHKNRQYGWLLVEAYEEFEDFLERIYAYMGKNDQSAWYLDDFGRAKLPDLDSKTFEWFLDIVKRKYRHRHRNLLVILRNLYPELRSVEEENIYNMHFRFVIELIANLRHCIVHSRGIVEDLDEFIERVLKGCGLWNNGNPAPKYRRFIETYFYLDAGTHEILLNERRPTPTETPSIVFYDVWGDLITYLIAYAHTLAKCVDPARIRSEWPADLPGQCTRQ